jgi:hypothetical protein
MHGGTRSRFATAVHVDLFDDRSRRTGPRWSCRSFDSESHAQRDAVELGLALVRTGLSEAAHIDR